MNPLAQLRDIHVPRFLGFWPPAVGWYLLLLLTLLILVGAWFGWRSYQRRIAPRQEALGKLAKLKQLYARDADPVAIAIELSMLLRRAALAKYPRLQVASLRDNAWLKFLDKTGNTVEFTSGVGQALITAPYQRQSRYPVDALFTVTEAWIKTNVKY